jgi:hypothetical protein
MTERRPTDQDVNRAIRSWLHEDRREDASRLAGAVLDRAEATPQDGSLPVARLATKDSSVPSCRTRDLTARSSAGIPASPTCSPPCT